MNSTKKNDHLRLELTEALLKKQLIAIRIQGYFDLLLIARNKISIAELQALSDAAGKVPVLIKNGKKIIMYGDSDPDSEGWRVISLKNDDMICKLPFPEKEEDSAVFISRDKIPAGVYTRLRIQQAHAYFKFTNLDSLDLHGMVERCFSAEKADKFFLLWSRIESKLPHITTQTPVSLTAKELDIVITEMASSNLPLNINSFDSFDPEIATKEPLY